MKKCTYCGKEYPDEAEVCAIDQSLLESDAPVLSAEAEDIRKDSSALPIQADEGLDVPDGFQNFGSFDPFEAAQLLRRFEADGIRFMIDRIEKSVETSRGIRKQALIQVYMHNDDYARAGKILSEDWKV